MGHALTHGLDVLLAIVGIWQELVMIGLGMDETSVRARLDECLLKDDEMAQEMPGNVWPLLHDPWPEWPDDDDDDQ